MKKIVIILAILSIPLSIGSAIFSFAPKTISYTVDVTMYNAVEEQCDADPLVTAAMYKINPTKASQHKWVAMSRNLLKRWGGQFKFGDKIHVSGTDHKDGVYIVADVMNARFTDRIDILETLGTKHYEFKEITITKL